MLKNIHVHLLIRALPLSYSVSDLELDGFNILNLSA